MHNANLSLIHPKFQTEIYEGIAFLALTTGALFIRNEAVKIVAATTLSTQMTFLSIAVLNVYHRKDFEQINPVKMQDRVVRSQNETERRSSMQ